MKGLFISHYSAIYGANLSLLNLLDSLIAFDVEPFVIIPQTGDLKGQLSKRKIPCRIVPMARWVIEKKTTFGGIIKNIVDTLYSLSFIEKYTNFLDVNFIYTNSSITPVGRIIALKKGIPHVWHIREFGKLDYDVNFVYPGVFTKRFIASSEAVICNSEAVKNYYFKKDRKNIHVVYNGIASLKQFDQYYENKKCRNAGQYAFSIVGRLSSSKGQDIAIKAIAELQKTGYRVKLIVVGDGEEDFVDYCKQLAIDLNVSEEVEFRGYLKDPYDVYNSSDCLLMCSEHEAMGRVVAEAMSACLPVIGRNSGGTPELIENGCTGILYDTFPELVDAMKQLVDNPTWGQELGLEGWKRAKRLFNTEQYVSRIYQILQDL